MYEASKPIPIYPPYDKKIGPQARIPPRAVEIPTVILTTLRPTYNSSLLLYFVPVLAAF